MRELSPEQANALLLSMVDAVPRKVLEATLRGEGKREAQIKAELSRWMPQAVTDEGIRRRVGDALGWFKARGDVERGRGGRYRCLPPYLVELPGDGSHTHLRLCGDPRAETLLKAALRPFAVRVRHHNPVINADSDAHDASRPSRGWDRVLAIPTARLSESKRICESRGIRVFDRGDLERALPRVSDVAAPPEDALESEAPVSGFWDVYRPNSELPDRWEASKRWRTVGSRLVRWKPGEGWIEARDCRYFYHGGAGSIAELDADAASLWQLYLDHEASRPRRAWQNDDELWVPRMLPSATLQWLSLMASEPAAPRGRWHVLTFGTGRLQYLVDTLERTLGLRCLDGIPEHDRAKGRRRGGWSE